MADLFTDAQLAGVLHVASVDATFAAAARQRATDYLRSELGVEFANASITLTKRVPRTCTFQRLLGPLTSVTSVIVGGSALTVGTDFEATSDGVSCPSGFGQYLATVGDWCDLVVVYVAGFASIPTELITWGLVLGVAAYDGGPRPGVRSSTVSVDGVSEARTYDSGAGSDIGLPEGVLKQLRAKYGTGRRQFGSVLVR